MKQCTRWRSQNLERDPCCVLNKRQWSWCIIFCKKASNPLLCFSIHALALAQLQMTAYWGADTKAFVGCNNDSHCIGLMKSSLIRLFSEQVLSSESNFEENENMCTAACVILPMWKRINDLERKHGWAMDLKLRLDEPFSAHITQYLSSYFFATNSFNKTKYPLRIQWLELWYSRYIEKDVTALLLHEVSVCVWYAAAKPSTTHDPDSVMGYCVSKSTLARKSVWYYYGNLAFADLGLRLRENGRYVEGVMSVPKHDFLTSSVCWKSAVGTMKKERRPVCTVWAKLSTMRFMNDSRNLSVWRMWRTSLKFKDQKCFFSWKSECAKIIWIDKRYGATCNGSSAHKSWGEACCVIRECVTFWTEICLVKKFYFYFCFDLVLFILYGTSQSLLKVLHKQDRPDDLYTFFSYSLSSQIYKPAKKLRKVGAFHLYKVHN